MKTLVSLQKVVFISKQFKGMTQQQKDNAKIYSSLCLMTIILFVSPFLFEALQEFDLYSVLNSH